MKIRFKIAITFGGFFLLVFLLVGTFVIYKVDKTLTTQIKDSLSLISKIKSEKIIIFLQHQREMSQLMAGSQVFRDFLKEDGTSINYKFKKEQAKIRLARSIGVDKNINEMFILDKNGKVVLSTDTTQEGIDKSKDSYFMEAQKSVFIKSVYLSETTHKLSYSLSAPILDDATNDLLGIVVSRLNIKSLTAVVEDSLIFGKTGESFLIDQNLNLLTPSRYLDESKVLNTKIDTQNVKECFSNPTDQTSVKNYNDYRGVPISGTHQFIPGVNWCLVTKMDSSEIFQPVTNIATVLSISIIAGIVVFFIISLFISKSIAGPIVKLTEDVKEITEKGNWDISLEVNSKDETGDLSRSFNKMVASVKSSRAEIESKVKEQTQEILDKDKYLENQQKATLNILEDVEIEKTRYEALLTGIGDGIIATDNETRVLVINQAAEKILGWKKEEVYGKKLIEVFTVVDEKGQMIPESERPINKAVSTMKPVSTSVNSNIFYSGKNGIKVPVALNASPVIVNGKLIGVIDVFRDITHEKDVDRMKTEFISLSSHQLRTPLSAIKWFGEMLLAGDAGKLLPEQVEFVTNINESTERMIALVNSLLNISRIESGRIIIDPVPTSLPNLVDDVVKEVRNKVDEKKQNLIISVHPDLPLINVDPKLIREVYKNLLTNSIKYTPAGGEISIFISKNEKEIVSQITDNGYGIPEAEQKKVFAKFFRAENIVKLETEGTGLGLYLVKAVVESSGGRVWYESREGNGTTFWFALPLTGSVTKSGEVSIDS
jgi:PAS domain S-box-containing protein